MKKILIATLIVLATINFSCSKNDSGSVTASAGTYTVKVTIENEGTLHSGTIYIDTELGNKTRDYSVFTDAHMKTMTGKTEWEGNYDVEASISAKMVAQNVTDNSVLTIYLIKDGTIVKKETGTGKNTIVPHNGNNNDSVSGLQVDLYLKF